MTISTYAGLQLAVKSWLHRASVGDPSITDTVPDLIEIGEKWIFRKARTREMEAALNVTISSGTATVPSDYVGLKHARLDGSPSRPLKVAPSRTIYEGYPLRSSDRKPFYIGVDGSTFIFGPYPDSNYTVLGIYYQRLTSVVSSANALFVANPDLYLFAALAEAEPYLKNDKRVSLWTAKRDSILFDINNETKESERDSGSMEIQVA